ncbi:MAG: hypothetical protein V4515_15025 [Chloroflexota bacterium]
MPKAKDQTPEGSADRNKRMQETKTSNKAARDQMDQQNGGKKGK